MNPTKRSAAPGRIVQWLVAHRLYSLPVFAFGANVKILHWIVWVNIELPCFRFAAVRAGTNFWVWIGFVQFGFGW